MKKTLALLMALLTALVSLLAGCGEKTAANTLKPYPLTEEQQEVLDYLNLRNTAQLFSYQPPEGALSITVSAMCFRTVPGLAPVEEVLLGMRRRWNLKMGCSP